MKNTLEDAPEWHKFLQNHVRGGRVRVLIDHLADIEEVERLNVTGAYICPDAKFNVTSDSYAMVDFVDLHGNQHSGAFWGPWDETVRTVYQLQDFMEAHYDPNNPEAGANLGNEAIDALFQKVGTNYAKKRYT